MKYIITEEQNKVVYVRRRINGDIDLIWDIVVEGADVYLCDIDNFNEYFRQVVNNSAMTYLLHYFDDVNSEGYPETEKYVVDFIIEKFARRIVEFWDDDKENC